MGGPGTHCSMTLFGSSLVRHGIEELWVPETEAATRTSAHEYCRSGHGIVAKQVSRHLGGEPATFPWDPAGCRVVRTSSTVLHQEDNGDTDTQLPP